PSRSAILAPRLRPRPRHTRQGGSNMRSLGLYVVAALALPLGACMVESHDWDHKTGGQGNYGDYDDYPGYGGKGGAGGTGAGGRAGAGGAGTAGQGGAAGRAGAGGGGDGGQGTGGAAGAPDAGLPTDGAACDDGGIVPGCQFDNQCA